MNIIMKKLLAIFALLISAVALGVPSHSFATTTTTSNSITAGGLMSHPGSLTTTVDQTMTAVTVNYHFVGTPDQSTIKVYSWLGRILPSSSWLDRSNLLITIPQSSSPVTKDFSVTYDFNALGLISGDQYAFYLATGKTDSDFLITPQMTFTVGGTGGGSYTFVANGQSPGSTTGMYDERFTITPTVPLTQPTTVKILTEMTGGSNPHTRNIPNIAVSGSNPVSVTMDDLAPGTYQAHLFDAHSVQLMLIPFTITAGAGQGPYTFTATGQFAGQAPGTFQEGFTVKPTTSLAQAVTLTLKTFMNGAATTLVSTDTFPIGPGIAAVSPSTNDLGPGDYTAVIYEGGTSVGSADFKITSSVPGIVQVISHVNVPSTTATISGTLAATGADIPNAHLVVKFGEDLSHLTISPKVAFSGTIPHTGVAFTVASDPFDPAVSNLYYYQFDETTTGTTLGQGSFYINTPADQVGGAINPGAQPGTPTNQPPACVAGPFTDDTTNDKLCSTGATVKDLVKTAGTWTWKCTSSVIAYTPASCTASVTAAAAKPSDDKNPDNFLKNPLSSSLNSFPKIIAAIVNNIVLPIMIPFIALMLIYSGFLFVIARKKGSTDGYAVAKKTLMYTMIGAALVLGAFVVSNALQGTLNDLLAPTTTTQ
ncbi:MAG: hypothetical protein JWM20_570 [Patescibacteria group bacterium]|nr:hypothetical protein [Patescibacteria group bacterium]